MQGNETINLIIMQVSYFFGLRIAWRGVGGEESEDNADAEQLTYVEFLPEDSDEERIWCYCLCRLSDEVLCIFQVLSKNRTVFAVSTKHVSNKFIL
jgi:hypothetical protein